jgi:GAF domain-containing protein
MLATIDETVRATVEADDFERLRVTGEMTWVLEEGTDTLDQIVEYEGRLNEYMPEKPLIGLCQYNRTRFPDDLLYDIIRAHPHQVYDATVTQNLAYLPPDKFFGAELPPPDAESFLDTHLSRLRAQGERHAARESVSALVESSRELLHGDRQGMVEQTIDTLRRGLSLTVAAFFLYDETTDDLEPERVWVAADEATTEISLPEQYRTILWETFVSNETQVVSNFQSDEDLPLLDLVLQSAIVLPLDSDGVLFVGAARAHAFEEADVEFAQAVAYSAAATLRRLANEHTLERQNERLRQLNRINETTRRIHQALIHASNREEIEAVVCNKLAAVQEYRFVWIGDREPLTDHFRPRQWAGDGNGFVDDFFELAADDASATHDALTPEHQTLHTDQPTAVSNVVTSSEFVSWRQLALEYDFQSAISLPLVYDQAEYGVLTIYSAEPNAMTDLERTVLLELAQTIAYAIDVVETRERLLTDRSASVTLRIRDLKCTLLRLANAVDGDLSIQTVLPRGGDTLRVFLTTSDVPSPALLDAADSTATVEAMQLISDSPQESLFEATITVESSLPATMKQFGVTVRDITATPDYVDVTVELPETIDIRDFVDDLSDIFDGTTVESIKRGTQSARSRDDVIAAMDDHLTDRQFEALRSRRGISKPRERALRPTSPSYSA